MAFFPNEEELPQSEKNEVPDEIRVLYSTSDGWLVQTDLDLLANLEEVDGIKDNPKILKAVSDLIAKQEPGSWMRLPQATLVILGDEAVKTSFGIPID
jgi:hypothetical protein